MASSTSYHHDNILTTMSTVVPALSLGVVTVMAASNVYRKVRRRFPITVNCWFCNQNTKVPYDDANSWHCPGCEQYNGFTEDGDYNCDIPAQRSMKLNGSGASPSVHNINDTKSSVGSPGGGAANGLCRDCNRNQLLKVQQVSAFQATSEVAFDREFEAYKKRLEETYRLCGKCDRTLKRRLYTVKKDILGAKLSEKKLFRKTNNTNAVAGVGNVPSSIGGKLRIVFTHFGVFLLMAFALFNLVRYSMTLDVTKRNLDSVLHPKLVHVVLVVMTYLTTIKSLIVGEKFLDISKTLQEFYVDDLIDGESSYYLGTLMLIGQILNLAAVILALLMLAVNRSTNFKLIAVLLMFSIQLSFSQNTFNNDFLIDGINWMTAFISLVIATFGSSSIKAISGQNPIGKNFNNSFRKLHNDLNDEETDEDDLSDTEDDSEIDSIFNKSSPSMKAKSINDDFQNQLNINGTIHHQQPQQQFRPIPQQQQQLPQRVFNNPFTSFADRERPLPTPTQFAQRPGIDQFNQINNQYDRPLSSPRPSFYHQQQVTSPLLFNQQQQQTSPKSSLFMRQQQSSPQSWVAGGFWNQCAAPPTSNTEAPLDFSPQMSRTSSQSSGFEGSVYGDFDRMSEPAPTYAVSSVSNSGGMRRGYTQQPSLKQQQFQFNQRFNGFPSQIPRGALLRNAVNKLNAINEISH